jgi:hypothetical protein
MADPIQDWGAVADSPSSWGAVADAAPLSWTDVGFQAVGNIPSSAVRFGEDIVRPLVHPIQTATGLANIGRGALQYAGLLSGNEHERYLDAVGSYLLDRYGGIENLKNTIASDPVGFAGDLSMVLTGGETALTRAPGLVGRAGEIAGTVGRAVNPVTAPLKAAQLGGRVASEALGVTTGAGGQALRTAARAGYEGGGAAQAFRESMRGQVPMGEVVEEAREGVRRLREQRSVAYRGGMANVAADTTVLPFTKIDQAVQRAGLVKTYKGQSLSPSTQGIRDQLEQIISDWRALPSQDFHTPEGLDALKQRLGDLRDATQYGTPERVVADQAYRAVRNTIIDQVPEYASAMKGYETASAQIREIEGDLSLNPNANIATSLRKLQSILRNDVSSAYGNRREMANFLVAAGAPHLMERLAGQALTPWTTRGIGKLGEQLALFITGGGAATGHLEAAAMGAATLPFTSPRAMGEAAYAAGRIARPLRRAGQRVPSITVPLAPAARFGDVLSNQPGAPQ